MLDLYTTFRRKYYRSHSFFICLFISQLFFSFSPLRAQTSWTYNFNDTSAKKNDSALDINSFAGNTAFLGATPLSGGVYYVKVGAAGGNIVVGNYDTAGRSMKLNASTSVATNKFCIYGWSPSSDMAYLKVRLKTSSASNGTLAIEIGSGALNSVYRDYYSYINGYGSSLSVLLINYSNGSISSVQRRNGNLFTTVTDPKILQGASQSVEFFVNNSSSLSSYSRNGIVNTINSQRWDLWVAGIRVSPNGGFEKSLSPSGVSLAPGADINGFAFFGENSSSNAASMYLDDLDYANYLPDATLSASSLASFGNVCVNGTSQQKSFVLSGFGLTGGNIKIGPLQGYTFSKDSAGTYDDLLFITGYGTSLQKSIYVRFDPLAAIAYDGNIPVSGGGTNSINVSASGSGVESRPLIAANIVNSTCYSSADGSIDLLLSGGAGPFTFAWSGPDLLHAETEDISNLTQGNYNVRINSLGGCISDTGFIVIGPDFFTASETSANILQDGGVTTLTVNANGGNGGYKYSLNGGLPQTDNNFIVSAGNYLVTVSDIKGCTAQTATLTLRNPSDPDVNISFGKINCKGGTTTLTVDATGGAGGYSYSLNGGTFQSDNTFNINAGNYYVTVKDANNASVNTPVIAVNEPSILTATVTAGNISCHGGTTTLSINASGGAGSYNYSLNGGAVQADNRFSASAGDYIATVTDANGCTVNTLMISVEEPSTSLTADAAAGNISCHGGTTTLSVNASGGVGIYKYSLNEASQQADNNFTVAAGNYVVTILDANGCEVVTNHVNISDPPILSASISKVNISCNGRSEASITLHPSGGTLPYQFSLNGSPFQNTETFSGLGAGNYTIKTKDANGCVDSASASITQPALLKLSIAKTNESCNSFANALLTLTATGGISPYQYNLNGGNYQTSGIFSGLITGTYAVSVKDANGCTSNASPIIMQPAILKPTATKTTVSCNGLSDALLSASSTGGKSPYQFNLNGSIYQSNGTFSGLKAGTYVLGVKDANACLNSINVSITQPGILKTTIAKTKVSCNGLDDASITIKPTGGKQPYQFNLNGGPYQVVGTFNGLAAGTYAISVKDANDCVNMSNVTIAQPGKLKLSVIKTNVSCIGGADGSLTANATSGTSPYQFSLNNGIYQSSGIFSGLSARTYAVSVKDGNGCTSTLNVQLTESSVSCSQALQSNRISNSAKVSKLPGRDADHSSLRVKLFPNPTETGFTLLLDGDATKPVEINVFDMYGKCIYHERGPVTGIYKFGEKFSSGVYIMEIFQGEMVKKLTVIKE